MTNNWLKNSMIITVMAGLGPLLMMIFFALMPMRETIYLDGRWQEVEMEMAHADHARELRGHRMDRALEVGPVLGGIGGVLIVVIRRIALKRPIL
jgi:hypothetical protein